MTASAAAAIDAAEQPIEAVPSSSVLLSRVLALGAPTMMISLLQVVAQVIETWLAARQGTVALAAWAVILPFALLLQQMSTGAMGGGVNSAIARALGSSRRDEAAALVLHAVIIALAAGLAFAAGLSASVGIILGGIVDAQTAGTASRYVWWLFGAGAVPAWLVNTFASVLRGGGRHALAARTLSLMWIAFPLLAWLLCEPAAMGLAGLGAAFALVNWAAAGAMAAIVLRGGAGFAPTLHVRPSGALFKRILAVGVTACMLALIANMTTILVTAQLKSYGTTAVAAYGISARMEFLMIPLAFGIGSALTALVGQAVGAGKWRTARRLAWIGGGLSFALTGAIGLAVASAPEVFASFFTADPGVARIAARALHFVGPAFGGFGLGMALYFAAMGAGRMRWPVFAALSRIGLAVGGGWLLSGMAGMGMDGYFLGVALGISAYGMVTAIGVRPGAWRASPATS